MPPKRTPVKSTKAATPTSKKKDKTSRVIVPEVRACDNSADSSASVHSVPAGAATIPAVTGVSPDFMAFIQMQERIRQEERVIMERQRKEDLERAEQERHHQQKAHEQQIQLLQAQLAAIARPESNGPKIQWT